MEIGGHTVQGENKSVQVEKEACTDIHTMGGEAVIGHIFAFPKLPGHGTHTVAHTCFGINRIIQSHETTHHARDRTDFAFGIVERQYIADVTVKYKPIENWKVSDKSESQKGSISSGDGSQITDEDFAFQSAVAMAAQVWGQSEHAKDASLSEVRVLLKNAKINGDADREGFSKLVDKSER